MIGEAGLWPDEHQTTAGVVDLTDLQSLVVVGDDFRTQGKRTNIYYTQIGILELEDPRNLTVLFLQELLSRESLNLRN